VSYYQLPQQLLVHCMTHTYIYSNQHICTAGTSQNQSHGTPISFNLLETNLQAVAKL